ncbi:MAG: Hsp20/alpha crystallin family protein [Actinobacteria bacterium]|nr:Hsp20/alpha crystallin family protein [Actinomycetota bacterium]
MLMRFDPFLKVDQLLHRAADAGRWVGIPMDAYRRGDEFVVDLDLPGVDRDSIDVTVERNVLQVSAERRARHGEDDQVLTAERPRGAVTRQLFLSEGVDTDDIRASYEDGVLTLVLPIAEEAKPYRIAVGAGHAAKAIDAGASR